MTHLKNFFRVPSEFPRRSDTLSNGMGHQEANGITVKRRSGGNSLIEYVLPLVIFFMAGGLLGIMLNIPDRLADYLADTLNGSREGSEIQLQSLGSGIDTASPATDPVSRIRELSTENGEIPSYYSTAELQQMLETAGANGTTRILSTTLEKQIEALQARGELDESQASMLKELANQGHRIARLEHYLEDAAQTSGTSEEYRNKMYLWDGEYLTTGQLQNRIGWGNGKHPKDIDNPLSAVDTHPETNRLVKLYQHANESGALSSPAAKAIVSELVSEIAFLSEVAEKGAHISGTQDPALFRDSVISEVTHYDSAGICHTGGHADSGIQCQ